MKSLKALELVLPLILYELYGQSYRNSELDSSITFPDFRLENKVILGLSMFIFPEAIERHVKEKKGQQAYQGKIVIEEQCGSIMEREKVV